MRSGNFENDFSSAYIMLIIKHGLYMDLTWDLYTEKWKAMAPLCTTTSTITSKHEKVR